MSPGVAMPCPAAPPMAKAKSKLRDGIISLLL
jgi:hypothetical protein